ncbi:MAG: M20/M25/M40 family metallo-hydrolase [Caulobacteraceae bacterium]
MTPPALGGRLAAVVSALAITAFCTPAPTRAAAPVPLAADQALGRAILKQLVEIDSTHAFGSTGAAKAIATRMIGAGFAPADVQVLIPLGHPTKGNVVIRLRGSGKARPLLYIGHLDVVEARREDWTYDPFVLTEKDGWFYGRGTIDMKGPDAALISALIRLKREGFVPDRDIVVAFTADEEAGGDFSGVDWLLKTHRDLIDAALVMNPDDGGGEAGMKNGRRLYVSVQTSEKIYVTYQLEAIDKGGHSSRPTAGNPIYRLARALTAIEQHPFPVHLTATTKAYFRGRAALETGQVKVDMLDAGSPDPPSGAIQRLAGQVETNILMRTTCVATMVDGGQGESALPRRARAVIQCRVIPGEPVERVEKALATTIDDPAVKITVFTPPTPSPESPPSPEVIGAVARVAKAMWPEVAILPIMSPGASDSAFTRSAGIPSYGVDGIFDDVDDERAHGRDERIGVAAFSEELEFTYRLMKALAGPQPGMASPRH